MIQPATFSTRLTYIHAQTVQLQQTNTIINNHDSLRLELVYSIHLLSLSAYGGRACSAHRYAVDVGHEKRH